MYESKAFCALGTKVFADHQEVAEVKTILIGRHVHATANWIPGDPAHDSILRAIRERLPMCFMIQLPQDRGTLQYALRTVNGQVELSPMRKCVLSFSFPAYEGAPDPTDDGPEVDIIQREQDIRFEEILRRHFRRGWKSVDDIMREQDKRFAADMEWVTIRPLPQEPEHVDGCMYHTSVEPVGGGFVQVTEAEEAAPVDRSGPEPY